MAKILILGGGFGGVVAAERLAKELGSEHQITLVSRSRKFVFYPALVRLAFGDCVREDVEFDLRKTMPSRRVNFIEAEVARIDPRERKVIIAHGEVEGKLPYDYLVFALGRRLATEKITGFYEHAHHLLGVDQALRFGRSLLDFKEGRAVIGECLGARLPVPIYETAFALARFMKARKLRQRVRITIVSPDPPSMAFGDFDVALALRKAFDAHRIEFLLDSPILKITPRAAITSNGHAINFDLLMLLPPFQGSSAASYIGITDDEGYIKVDGGMRVFGQERMYAVGDCVAFSGPKMGHMAVRQGEVAAANLLAELQGREPNTEYSHEMRLVIAGAEDSIYVHKDIWTDEPANVREGRFWAWAKRAQEKYWQLAHS